MRSSVFNLPTRLVLALSFCSFALLTYGKTSTLSNILESNTADYSLGANPNPALRITLTATGRTGEPLCLYSMTFTPYATYSNGTCSNPQRPLCMESTGLDGRSSPCGGTNNSVYFQTTINVGGSIGWFPESIYDMGDGLHQTYYDSGATQCIKITNVQARSGSSCTSSGTPLNFTGSSENIPVSSCANSDTCAFGTSSVSITLS